MAQVQQVARKTLFKRISTWIGIILVVLIIGMAAAYQIADWARPPMDDAARTELLREGKAQQFVKTSQGTMNVRISGPVDGPIVLLVHGGVVGGHGFAGWQKPLADAGYRVIVPDLLGYGDSDRPDVTYNRIFYVKQINELLDGLHIKQPVNIVGASLGGAIVTAFTADHPDRVRSVALMSPSGLGHTQLTSPVLQAPVIGDWIFRVFGASTLQAQMAQAYENTPGRDAMIAWMKEQSKYKGFAEGVLKTLRDYDSEYQPQDFDALGQSGLPVFAAWGTKDEIHPYSFSKLLQQRVPQTELLTLEGKGHAITYGQAETVLSAVIPFLAAHNGK
jgi:pimeloyl-ACP methyl ester carboxylesterase